jgi:hypothetical protein
LQQLSVNRETLHSSLDLTGLLKLKRVGIDTHNESIAYAIGTAGHLGPISIGR